MVVPFPFIIFIVIIIIINIATMSQLILDNDATPLLLEAIDPTTHAYCCHRY